MSASEELQQILAIPIRTLQIIVASLTLGPLIFLLVVLFAIEPPPRQGVVEIGALNLTTLSVAFALAALFVSFLVPASIVARARRETAARNNSPSGATRASGVVSSPSRAVELWNAYMAKTIVGTAILEGTCFFLIIAYNLERQPVALTIAAIFITAIACHFPTTTRIGHWLEDQLQKLDQERAFQR